MRSVFFGGMFAAFVGLVVGSLDDAEAASGDRRSISRSDVNVRTGPSLDEPIVMTINPGEAIIEVAVSGDWYRVELPDRNLDGWIYGPLLDNGVTADPATSPAAPFATKTAPAQQTPAQRIPAPSDAPAPEQAATADQRVAALEPRSGGDPVEGEKLFYKCGACHTTARGVNAIGPSLYGVVGSRPGRAPGFGYSTAMRRFAADGAVWDEATLDEFIRRPSWVVKGTDMPFSGIRSAEDRRHVIAYLKQLDR